MSGKIIENEQGQALVLVIFVMLFVFLMVTALSDLISIDLQIVNNQLRSVKADYIAEAGVEDAISRLRLNRDYAVSNENVEFPSGSGNSYSITITNTDNTIISTGTLLNFQRVKQAKFRIMGRSSPYKVNIMSWKTG